MESNASNQSTSRPALYLRSFGFQVKFYKIIIYHQITLLMIEQTTLTEIEKFKNVMILNLSCFYVYIEV